MHMLKDGEYDIDLLALLGPSEDVPTSSSSSTVSGSKSRLWTSSSGANGTVAIRYGFIPETMDPKGLLTMYVNEQEWLLQAQSTDHKPLIFEGLQQQQQPKDSESGSEQSYYFVYDPSNVRKLIQLKPLGTSIRFNKSRNVQRLQKRIQKWHEDTAAPNQEGSSSGGEPRLKSPPKIEKRDKPTARTTARSLKRPPANSDANIISESDFEDLGDGDEFPVFEITDLDPVEEAVSSVSETTHQKQRQKQKQKPKSRKKAPLEDDFKDLEDQLAEVLEDEEEDAEADVDNSGRDSTSPDSNPSVSTLHIGLSHEFDSDSDSESDDNNNNNNNNNVRDSGSYNHAPVASVLLINDDDDEKPAVKTPSAFDGAFDSAKKPMSLRQLIGGANSHNDNDNDDDDNLSMSEEE